MPVSSNSNQGAINPWNILARCLWHSNEVALRVLLKRGKNIKLENHIFGVVSVSGADETSWKCEQKIKSQIEESPNTADKILNSELFDVISETKKSLEETFCQLDILKKYIESPSEETAKPLKLLTDREERREESLIAESKVEKFLNYVVNECFQSCESQTKGDNGENSSLQACNPSLEEVSNSKEGSPIDERENQDMETKLNLLENKIHIQNEEIKLLKIENEELLAHLGELLVENDAKKSKEKKAEVYYHVYPSSLSNAIHQVVSNKGSGDQQQHFTAGNRKNVDGNCCQDSNWNKPPKRQITDKNIKLVKVIKSSGLEAERTNDQLLRPNDATFQNTEALHSTNSSSRLLRIERTNRVEESSDVALTSQDGQNCSTQQMYEGLSVQKDDLNRRRFLSLENNLPTSVVSTFISTEKNEVVLPDGPVTKTDKGGTKRANSLIETNHSLPDNASDAQTLGGNDLKLSKPQRRNTEQSNGLNSRNPDSFRNHQAWVKYDNWLCSHYKRHCSVKFECCEKFWPCHRCHNDKSNCSKKKPMTRGLMMVKCIYCNKVQPFSQFCGNCNAKFADYFCGLCQNLTDKDDHPYHCEKCRICRIHGDRSFHCDVCGVCMDVQHQGNHECREGLAYDECCVCLENVSKECQKLPCSHKVHKECASEVIKTEIIRCPICQTNFADKLGREPLPDSRN